MLWVAFALMTGAAVLAVLWPLGRRRESTDALAVDRAFYDTELAGIARDEALVDDALERAQPRPPGPRPRAACWPQLPQPFPQPPGPAGTRDWPRSPRWCWYPG